MTNSPTEIISILNSLIETCKDGQEGFRIAAENIADDDELKTLFNQYSLQRAKFAGELQTEARSFGEHSPENQSSMAGAVHRGWINLKSAISSGDKHSVLSECERGEDVALEEYRKAAQAELPAPLNAIVQNQLQEVIIAHNRIRFLRDSSVEETRSRFGALQEKGSELTSSAAETWGRTRDKAQDLLKTSGHYIRENPIPMIVGAITAGLAIGLLVRYVEKSRCQEEDIQEENSDRDLGIKAAMVPLLWPIFKAIKGQYDSSTAAAKKVFRRSKRFDIESYVKPIVKKVKRVF